MIERLANPMAVEESTDMEFTYNGYKGLLCLLKEHGYKETFYTEWNDSLYVVEIKVWKRDLLRW